MLFRIFIGLTQNTRGNAVCELLQKLGFIMKIQIKRTLCDVRFLYDLIDRGLVNALFKEKLIGRLEKIPRASSIKKCPCISFALWALRC